MEIKIDGLKTLEGIYTRMEAAQQMASEAMCTMLTNPQDAINSLYALAYTLHASFLAVQVILHRIEANHEQTE